MKIYLNDAGNGDSIILATENTTIMIDGGTAASYNIWKKNVSEINKIDALFVTHIDNDHVNGLIRMFEEKAHPVINEIFYNGIEQVTNSEFCQDDSNNEESSILDSMISNFSDDVEGESNIGFSEGTSLSFLLRELSYNVNERFDGKVITNTLKPNVFSIGDVTIEIIGPSNGNISSIKNNWLEVLSEYGVKRKLINKKCSVAFEKYIDSLRGDLDVEDICEASEESIENLSNKPFIDDNSLNNMSSISFIAECNKKKILLLGDSDARTILEWMDCKGYETINVDAVKLPHHGSKHNYNKELLERVLCNKYLISTNGRKHSHPDLETLARIVRYSKKQPVNIFINHSISHIDESFKEKVSNYSRGSNILTGEREIFL